MQGLVIHQVTKRHMEQFLGAPAHALLLTGPNGIGKASLARSLAADILGLETDRLTAYPYFSHVEAGETGNIPIEAVRGAQKFLQLKTTGVSPLRRIVLVEHADGLTPEAQNAFLKILEEPPADTVVMLTAESRRSLLPTILSRVQHIPVQRPAQEHLMEHFVGLGKPQTAMTQAYFLSGGLPGLMHSILSDESDHPLLSSVAFAKELLQKTTFERLAMVDSLSKQKANLASVLDALARIAESGLKQAAEKQDPGRVKQWHRIRKEVLEAQAHIAASANAKLALTKMLLHI